ncbi:MAG: SPOR domain-containing protein [Pseudomonadota bacterium]
MLVCILFAGSSQSSVAMEAERQELPVGSNIKDTAWVWSQNPNHYAIQLAGGGDEMAIEAMMRGISLSDELAVVQSQRNGQPWYTLVYGSFASKAAAKGVVTRLPASLKKTKPWIRRFSALQDEIAQATAR